MKRRWPIALAGVLVAFSVVGFVCCWHRAPPTPRLDADLVRSLPRMKAIPGFATSDQCRECHPSEHASWHASFHRQMTQVALPETILGPFDGTIVRHGGAVHRLVRKGDELWVESSPDTAGTDPLPSGEGADAGSLSMENDKVTAQRVVMTTGAHHMQACWAADGKGNRLRELPVIYIRDPRPEKSRWAPLEASYLSPTPPDLASRVHWNTDCVLCHATAGVPGLQETGATRTAVSELGISCESCHGPGQRHIDLKRERQSDEEDHEQQAIVNPARLHPERAAQVCGHCHSAAVFASQRLMEDFFLAGSSYRPGDDLLQTRIALLPGRLSKEQNEANERYSPFYEGSYWADGMIRVTGREYNGLVESTCYQKGGMTCLSCHSMHQSEPDDQLSAAGRGNEACYQCHASYREKLTAHTHHPPGSSGSECYNCHMPHTTYGLFSAIRSHQITSPKVADALATGRPAACNLCHLDQTLEWAARTLTDWYGHAPQTLDAQQRSRSAAGVLLLKGDAAQRVLLAWGSGWKPAIDASNGSKWLPPLLAPLLDDPSPVVRLVVSRSLSAISPLYEINYDFVAAPKDRRAAAREIVSRWDKQQSGAMESPLPRVFVKPDGKLDEEQIQGLLRERDDRGLFFIE